MEEFDINKGINTNYFICQSEIEDFICSICQCVPNPNTALEESKCGHIFCSKCLRSWMEKKFTCPFCRADCLIRALKTNNKFVYRLMMKFKINCPHNCSWKGELASLEAHLERCAKLNIPCKFDYIGCKFKGTSLNKTNHENNDDKIHFTLAIQHIKRLENKLNDQENYINMLSDKIRKLEERENNLQERNMYLENQMKQIKEEHHNDNNINHNNKNNHMNINNSNRDPVNLNIYQVNQLHSKIPIHNNKHSVNLSHSNKYQSRNNNVSENQKQMPLLTEPQETINYSLNMLDIQSGERCNTSINNSIEMKNKRTSSTFIDQVQFKNNYNKMKGNLFSLSAKKFTNTKARFNYVNPPIIKHKNNCINLNYCPQKREECHDRIRNNNNNTASPFYVCERKMHYTMDNGDAYY